MTAPKPKWQKLPLRQFRQSPLLQLPKAIASTNSHELIGRLIDGPYGARFFWGNLKYEVIGLDKVVRLDRKPVNQISVHHSVHEPLFTAAVQVIKR